MKEKFWDRVEEHEKEGFLKDFLKEFRLKDEILTTVFTVGISLNLPCSAIGLIYHVQGNQNGCLVALIIAATIALVLFVLFIFSTMTDKEDPMLREILKDEISNYIFKDDNRRHDFLNSRAEKLGRFRFRDAEIKH